jgi:hypothetical protein
VSYEHLPGLVSISRRDLIRSVPSDARELGQIALGRGYDLLRVGAE